MLLFLALWALVPCLVLVTLYFLSSVGGKSGGNKKNDGVKVSPPGRLPGPASGSISANRAWLSGLGQDPGLADGVLGRCAHSCSHAVPRPRDLGFDDQDWWRQAGEGED